MSQQFSYDPYAEERSSQSSVVQIDSGKHVAVVAICTALCAIAACFAIFAFYVATLTERESRMESYYITELDATLSKQGIREPSDNYQKFKSNHKE